MKKQLIAKIIGGYLIATFNNVTYLQAQDATKLVVVDTRNTNSAPGDYTTGLQAEFKAISTLAAPGNSNYGGLLTLSPWSDASGDKRHQLFFNNSGIFWRTGVFGQPSWETWQKLLVENANGRVGIGTLNDPLARLEVYDGNVLVKNLPNATDSSAVMIGHAIKDAGYTYGTSIRSITQNPGANMYGLQFFTQENYITTQTEKMRIQGNGNVGIGTANPTEKLSVNGNIRAKQIKVETANWPDYVFASNYKKMPLPELEQFIAKNKHLPEIPSAQQVAKEGIELGANQATLLKKIEELTLYIIDQNKELKKQNEIIYMLKQKVGEIEKAQCQSNKK
ncbi:hypothetical protein ACTJIJ_22325 [Niabella sp. 22666]|uniref:hypothetical protein n=1 Tax=Niabella sp. 22666 TaxID=3453954 RepID=UPI003F83E999